MELSPSSGLIFAIVNECVMDIDAFFPQYVLRDTRLKKEQNGNTGANTFEDLDAVRSGMEQVDEGAGRTRNYVVRLELSFHS